MARKYRHHRRNPARDAKGRFKHRAHHRKNPAAAAAGARGAVAVGRAVAGGRAGQLILFAPK